MKASLRLLGIFMMLASVIGILGYTLFSPVFIEFLAAHSSADHYITDDGQRQLSTACYFALTLFFVLGLGAFASHNGERRAMLAKVFLDEPVCDPGSQIKPSPKIVLIVSSLVGVFMIIHIHLYDASSAAFRILYKEDGVFESLTPILFTISAIFLGISIRRIRRDPRLSKISTVLVASYGLLILAFIAYAGEEISWGQRILGWGTPDLFQGNVQSETNVHNYFNSYYDMAYRFLALVPVLVLLSAALESQRRWLALKRLVLPHPSMIGLGLLIAFVAAVWYHEQELMEEMVAVFVFFYGIRIWSCFRAKRLSIGIE